MKNHIIKLAGLIVFALLVSGCEQNFENPVGETASYTNGNADFSKYVAIGDSLTAGYADGALYKSGQENSFPAILAQQFAAVDSSTFTQPLVDDNLGGLLFNGVENPTFGNRLVLNAEPKNPPDDLDPKGPELMVGAPTTEVLSVVAGPFNNMGVPGAKSFHLQSTAYANPAGLTTDPVTANPYFVRFASATDASIIEDAVAQQASFFTLWIGNNDVLAYAGSGGEGEDQTGNMSVATYGKNDITDPDVFKSVYTNLLSEITTNSPTAKGVLINIADISTIPYFTTVPYNAVPLDSATAAALNTTYSTYNQGVQAALGADSAEAKKRTINFVEGQNAVVITDEYLTDLTGAGLPSIRQASAADLLVLTTSSKIGTLKTADDPNSVWGIGEALEDGDVLIPSEIDAINTARKAYNVHIKELADANPNLLFIDAAAIMSELGNGGIDYGTGFIDAAYATGGAFSLDGVHPTARGYAVISNEIIDAINTGFTANIPKVDPGVYSTIFIK